MAALNSCASLALRGAQSRLLATPKPRQLLPVKVEPVRRRRGGVVANSLEAFSSFTDETPVRDTGVKDMVDKQMADASQEFAEMDLEEAAEKYNLQEQLFTEVDYCQVSHNHSTRV
jgi:hypothetical protein